MPKTNTSGRNAIYAKIAIARKQLAHMDEDSYRALLERETGKRSAKECTIQQLGHVIHSLEKLGATFSAGKKKSPRSQGSQSPEKRTARRTDFIEITDSMPYAREKRQILAIWRKLGYSMSSLDTRVKRAFGVHAFVWLQDGDHVRTLLNDLVRRENTRPRTKASTVNSTV